jgi:hypothetical protein
MKAVIMEAGGSPTTQVEIYWSSPFQWRRTLQGEDFSQTLIVNQDRTFEEDSDDYFPIGLRSLLAAMLAPEARLAEMTLRFADYRTFAGKKVPRLIWARPQYGTSWRAQITELEVLRQPDASLFSVPETTPAARRLRVESLPEADFRKLATEQHEVVWPQVLDGAVTGVGRYYVSIDRTGAVREVYPVRIDNERANESACRQIMSWKFKPAMRDGVAVQAESILNFSMNTRAWGPHDPLNDEEARKLVSEIVEPVIPAGTAAPGSTYTLRAAIDSEGRLIEVIAGDGPRGLFSPCYDAIRKWHFKPVMENGEPRPYRAEIRFVVP